GARLGTETRRASPAIGRGRWVLESPGQQGEGPVTKERACSQRGSGGRPRADGVGASIFGPGRGTPYPLQRGALGARRFLRDAVVGWASLGWVGLGRARGYLHRCPVPSGSRAVLRTRGRLVGRGFRGRGWSFRRGIRGFRSGGRGFRRGGAGPGRGGAGVGRGLAGLAPGRPGRGLGPPLLASG